LTPHDLTRRQVIAAAAAIPFASNGFAANDWPAIERAARGQTVYFNAWAGSERINAYLQWTGSEVGNRFGVKFEHVKIGDTAEAVKRVRAEKQAARVAQGSIDMVWINGENFLAMKRDGLLFGPFSESLPSYANVDTSGKPTTRVDFSVPVEGMEAPWGMAQLTFFGDGKNVPNELVTQVFVAVDRKKVRIEDVTQAGILFDARLGFGIGTEWCDRVRLGQQLGLRAAVDGAGAREDKGADVVTQGGFDQRVGPGGVVVEIAFGFAHRFTNLDIAGEMDHGAWPVAVEYFVQAPGVADIAAFERSPAHRPVMAFLQRVVAHGHHARFGQRLADVTTNIAGAAGHQNAADHRANSR